MGNQSFQSVDVPTAHSNLPDLCKLVHMNQGRIQINCGDEAFVLISKKELDALERALEVLSESDGMKSLCGAMEQVAGVSRPPNLSF